MYSQSTTHDAIEQRITGLSPTQLSFSGTQPSAAGHFHSCGLRNTNFRFFGSLVFSEATAVDVESPFGRASNLTPLFDEFRRRGSGRVVDEVIGKLRPSGGG